MYRWLFNLLLRPVINDVAYSRNVDKFDGEPLLAEEALVHAKSEAMDLYIVHFYIAARDTVVNCEVPYEIWRDLERKKRGLLTHQGGLFHCFETEGIMYCEEGLYSPSSPD